MMFVNSKGAAKLLGVSPVTIWRWCDSGRVRSYPYAIHTLIPLSEVAREAEFIRGVKITEKELLDEADALGIPVWILRVG